MAERVENGAGADTAWDTEVDVLIVGSGGGGMTAALAAKAAGLEPFVIEKAALFGGSTSMSGGGVWVPNAPVFKRLGENDDPAKILDYLIAIAGERVDHKRLERYVEAAPQMMEFLEQQSPYLGDAFFWSRGYSDYHPDKGGNPLGRGLWAKPIDRRKLGEDDPYLRAGKVRLPGLPRGMWMTGLDLHSINRIRWGVGGLGPYKTLFTLAWRVVRHRLFGEQMVANGAALATRLRLALREKGIDISLQTPMKELIVEDGRVVGVLAERDGKPFRIRARRGVLLATGGFENNPEMRPKYQPTVGKGWSVANPDSQGDGIRAGEAAGAAIDLMDDAWWYPVFQLPGRLFGSVAERQYPGQFVVNGAGKRFVNEATPYTDFGHAQIEGHETGVSHIPAWMVLDSRAWKRNIICGHFPGWPMPKDWLESGMVKKADSFRELAGEIGVPPDALEETAARYNGFARQGKDEDFHRGESPYDNWYADPSSPNPNLAEVSKGPFYAFQIFPGDLGTKGGVLTDENARALRPDGTVIEGLYACGNASASVMGNDYAGPGATIGPAMTFGFVAARHIAGVDLSDDEPTSAAREHARAT
jgi:succinate dehydrogenase/fumarate reductase flavoprotein subunit